MLTILLLAGIILGILTAALNLSAAFRPVKTSVRLWFLFVAVISAISAAVFIASVTNMIDFMPTGGNILLLILFLSQVALAGNTLLNGKR